MSSVLVIGSGGREHAICWKLAQSPSVKRVYCAPGNPGIASVSELVPIAMDDISGLLQFAEEKAIDLTVVGPEYPLTLGIVDAFEEAGLAIFGPRKDAAQMEGSKVFAKEVMMEAGVPTARYDAVGSELELRERVSDFGLPVVLKADGLAAGKGVCICQTEADVDDACTHLFSTLGASSVLIEQFLVGKEASFIVATDGERIVPFLTAHDYKRIYDHDQGPNTGGMGCVAPTPNVRDMETEALVAQCIKPVLETLQKKGIAYKGFLYGGLMIGEDGQLHVLEFNARMGDPETQVILPCMQGDFFALLQALTSGAVLPDVRFGDEAAVCLVLASEGYPQEPKKGDVIEGIAFAAQLPDTLVFHAGTALQDGVLCTAGGRVLTVVAKGPDQQSARAAAYRAADMIQFRGRQLRRDIGAVS